MKYQNLTLIGTSHIAKQSLREIEEAFKDLPGVVAVELDRNRLHSLLTEQKTKLSVRDISRVGFKGYMFALIGGWLQRKLGSIVGVMPGSEMKLAVVLAKKHNARIALIDQNIEITLRKFSQRLTWREKFRFVSDMFKGIFFKKRAMKELGVDANIDLSKVPDQELINKMMKQLKVRYPNVYDVLVHQRNVIMSNNIVKLMHQFPDDKILAVVGAGHEEDILAIVKKKMEARIDIV
jgi:pheromone shutdown-related protein TraB